MTTNNNKGIEDKGGDKLSPPSPLNMEETTVVLKYFIIGNATIVISFKGEKMIIGMDAPEEEKKIEINLKPLISSAVSQALEEERQFILNVLDGIDEADRQMNNTGGGTLAIRHALQSRIIK